MMTREKTELTTRSIPRRSPIQVLTPPQSSLTAVIGREPVYSRGYGREHVCVKRICLSFIRGFAKDKNDDGEKTELTTRSIPRRSLIQVLTPPSLV